MSGQSDWRWMWALRPAAMPLVDRLRLGLPTIVILVGSAFTGRFLEGLLIALGTYVVLFGGIPRRRHRAMVMVAAAVGLILSVCLGIVTAGSLPWTLLAYVVAALAAFTADTALRAGPPGPYFFVLMVGGGGIVGQSGMGVAQVLLPVSIGGIVAIIAAVAGKDHTDDGGATARFGATLRFGALVRRTKERLRWPGHDSVMFVRVLLGAVVALSVTTLAGNAHPFWAVLVVVLVLSFPAEPRMQLLRAIHRVAGTAVGFFAFWAWSLLDPPALASFCAMGVLLWISMGMAPRNYGYACIAITLLALLMTQALSPGTPPGQLALDRVGETAIGAVIAIVCMLLVRPRNARR